MTVEAAEFPGYQSIKAAWHQCRMQGGWVYIMTNPPHGALYVGVTSDLARRAWEHRSGVSTGFTSKFGLARLVYAERQDDMLEAIRREKAIKGWRRAWKVRLIEAANAEWTDLFGGIA